MKTLVKTWIVFCCGLGSALAQTNGTSHVPVAIHLGPPDPPAAEATAKTSPATHQQFAQQSVRPQLLTATNGLPREAKSGIAAPAGATTPTVAAPAVEEPSASPAAAPMQGSATRKLNPDKNLRDWRTKYGGIIVQVRRADNPLQLINPFAPAEYGAAEANLPHDAVTSLPTGLILFSVRF